MKLDKAIEILTAEREVATRTGRLELHDALQIAIGALKRCQDMRISPCTTADEVLPGETEE